MQPSFTFLLYSANLESNPSKPPSGHKYLHQNLSAARFNKTTAVKINTVSKTKRTPMGVRGNTAGRINPSSHIRAEFIQGIFDRNLSEAVKAVFKEGAAPLVKVLIHNVMGSMIRRVRLPNSAAIKITHNNRYFPMRNFSGTAALCRGWRRNGNTSKTAPTGQIQPHQALPSKSVNAMVIKHNKKPVSSALPATARASTKSGSKWANKWIILAGVSEAAAISHKTIHALKKTAWVILLNRLQEKRSDANRQLLDVQTLQIRSAQIIFSSHSYIIQIFRLHTK